MTQATPFHESLKRRRHAGPLPAGSVATVKRVGQVCRECVANVARAALCMLSLRYFAEHCWVYGRVCSQAQSCVVRIHSTTMGMYWEVLLPLD